VDNSIRVSTSNLGSPHLLLFNWRITMEDHKQSTNPPCNKGLVLGLTGSGL
jgi:hypothetical protein